MFAVYDKTTVLSIKYFDLEAKLYLDLLLHKRKALSKFLLLSLCCLKIDVFSAMI